MKKCIILVLIGLSLSACVRKAPEPVVPMPTATFAPSPVPTEPATMPTPAMPAPTELPTPLPLPTEALQPINLSARVGLNDHDPYWLTYDSNLWVSEANPENDYARVLVHKNLAGCQIRQDLGRGAPSSWAVKEETETIGNTRFRVQRWSVAATGEWTLVSFYWDDTRYQIMVIPGEDPALCMEAAREVIRISEGLGFASIQRP